MNFVYTWRKQWLPMTKAVSDLSLLVLRVWLAQEFLFSSYTKLAGGLTAPEWFGGLHFPLPYSLLSANLNWILVGTTEAVCGAALLFGLFSRVVALILLYVTYVAVYSVHFDLGWAGWNMIETDDGQGFKVPLMIAVMLLAVLGQGAGRWSLDAWLCRFCRYQSEPLV